MTYQRFEDLPAWQKAAELYELTEDLLEDDRFQASRGFRDQLERAALSVSNNIAEGFERGTTNELLAFLYIARGSAGEGRSLVAGLETWDIFRGWKSPISKFITGCAKISKHTFRRVRRFEKL